MSTMPRIVDDGKWRRVMEELEAYRSTGLTPKEILALMIEHNDPAPMPIDLGDGGRRFTGLLEED